VIVKRTEVQRDDKGEIVASVAHEYASQDEYDGAMLREAFVAAHKAGDRSKLAHLVRARIQKATESKAAPDVYPAVMNELGRINRWLAGAGLPVGSLVNVTIDPLYEASTRISVLRELLVESQKREARLDELNARLRESQIADLAMPPNPYRPPRRRGLTEAQLYAREYRRVNAGQPA